MMTTFIEFLCSKFESKFYIKDFERAIDKERTLSSSLFKELQYIIDNANPIIDISWWSKIKEVYETARKLNGFFHMTVIKANETLIQKLGVFLENVFNNAIFLEKKFKDVNYNVLFSRIFRINFTLRESKENTNYSAPKKNDVLNLESYNIFNTELKFIKTSKFFYAAYNDKESKYFSKKPEYDDPEENEEENFDNDNEDSENSKNSKSKEKPKEAEEKKFSQIDEEKIIKNMLEFIKISNSLVDGLYQISKSNMFNGIKMTIAYIPKLYDAAKEIQNCNCTGIWEPIRIEAEKLISISDENKETDLNGLARKMYLWKKDSDTLATISREVQRSESVVLQKPIPLIEAEIQKQPPRIDQNLFKSVPIPESILPEPAPIVEPEENDDLKKNGLYKCTVALHENCLTTDKCNNPQCKNHLCISYIKAYFYQVSNN